MRIISQNGTIDMPYDMCCVWRQEEVIYCRAIGSDDNVTMATYSSENKAEKAVEMLRIAYIGMPVVMQNVEITDELKKQFDNSLRTGIILLNEKEEAPKIDLLDNSVFRFPKAENVE